MRHHVCRQIMSPTTLAHAILLSSGRFLNLGGGGNPRGNDAFDTHLHNISTTGGTWASPFEIYILAIGPFTGGCWSRAAGLPGRQQQPAQAVSTGLSWRGRPRRSRNHHNTTAFRKDLPPGAESSTWRHESERFSSQSRRHKAHIHAYHLQFCWVPALCTE